MPQLDEADDGTIYAPPWVYGIVYGSFGGGLLVSLVLYRRQIVSCSYNLVATKNSSLVQIEDVGGPCARRMIRTAAPSTVSSRSASRAVLCAVWGGLARSLAPSEVPAKVRTAPPVASEEYCTRNSLKIVLYRSFLIIHCSLLLF